MTFLRPDKPPKRKLKRVVIFVALLAAGYAVAASLRVGPAPEISIAPERPGIGRLTPIAIQITEPKRGLGEIRVELEHEGGTAVLAEKSYEPLSSWRLWGARVRSETLELEVGSETVDGLVQGDATLRVTAERSGTWLRGAEPAVAEMALPVRLSPPRVTVLSTQHYPAQGGSEAVVYQVGPTAVRDGVEVDGRWFPGYALPGGTAGDRFALFGIPFDLEDANRIRVVAEDELENRAGVAFVDRFFKHAYKTDDIEVSDRFMARVVPAILESTPGFAPGATLLESYVKINRELRKANSQTLDQLAAASREGFAWSRPFVPMDNAQVMSAFADRRTYLYEGEEIDRQDHLGFDLASVRRAPIPAANDGVVVLARFFGIYGNAVVIDHGYGLLSLYGHLSTIAVAEGEAVGRGQEVGRSGETGLAGGDHLHFTMLLHGLPVTPVEWWDGGWIRDRIARKLGDALPFKQ